jgi:hypothetical protein
LKVSEEETLRCVFFEGLRQPLKQMAAYKFEVIKDYDKLKVEIRKMENELNANKEKPENKAKC